MIGNFARLMRAPPRTVELEEPARDAPPERFVEKLSDEGGDVYIAPVLEALRAALRARLGRADPSTDAPEGGTAAPGTGAP